MYRNRLLIDEVFTPRTSEVNERMYVQRDELEKALLRAFRNNMHNIIFGESGNGKSWLYKKSLSKAAVPFVVANCANADRLGSITQEICNVIVGAGRAVQISYHEETSAKANAIIAEGQVANKKQFELTKEEPLLDAFKIFDSINREVKKVIVLDNFEFLMKKTELMNELGNLLILLDDSRYAKCNINFLIVGLPNNVIEYFSQIENLESVANRLYELPKVGSLTSKESRQIISRGFELLIAGLSEADIEAVCNHVYNITLGIAQKVHEYCRELAYVIEENNWKFNLMLLRKADEAWMRQGLRKSVTIIDEHLNSRDTTVGRRNQVIYVIGKVNRHHFDSNYIDSLIREHFPSTAISNMGIGSILGDLASEPNPLLKRSPNSTDYSVIDPLSIMCIRLMLYIHNETKKVMKRGFSISQP